MWPGLKRFLQRHGLRFRDPALVEEALTHASYRAVAPDVAYNERLEFLGDAVLDLVVGEWLFRRFPRLGPRDLTRYRAALVDRDQLAAFARAVHLQEALRLSPSAARLGEAGQRRILADAFEALVGALYLDQGLGAVRAFVFPLVEAAFPQVRARLEENFKGRLQEWSQEQGLGVPHYEVVEQKGAQHDPWFRVRVRVGKRVMGEGTGHSRKEAEQQAARAALQHLGLLEGDEAPKP